jgi:hypothetical protein
MAKKCMKCGGSTTPKMKKGGMPTKVLGPAKKPFAAGIPFFTGAGQTGPEYMKKGGMVKKKYQAGGSSSATDRMGTNTTAGQVFKPTTGSGSADGMYSNTTKGQMIKPGMKKGGATKKMAKGGSSFGMLSVKAGVDKNPKPTAADRIAGAKMQNGGTTPRNMTVNSRPVPKTKYTQPSKKPMMAKKGGLVKKQLGGPATPNNPNPTRTLENAALFVGGGLATALAARKQNQPMTQKKKEKVLAKQQKQAMRKKK